MDEILEDGQKLFTFLSETERGPETADLVLAMGSQDLSAADAAAQVFFERRAEWLVCSGGFGKDTSALFREPEAVLFGRRCAELGVPEDRILLERESANSGENFQFTRVLLEKRGIFPKTGVAVTKPYMVKRAWATGSFQWPEVRWSAASRKVTFPEYLEQGNELETVLNLMAGDLQRLRVYAGRFQTPVEVPEDIWRAYERLAGDGYDRYVIREV